MKSEDPLAKGLVFFSPGTPAGVRRRRWTFVALVALAAAALTWPVYPLFSGIRPLILGLPLSLAWVVLWLVVVFAALVWLYRADDARKGGEG